MRQISPEQTEQLLDAIHAVWMTAEVINRTSVQDMTREPPDGNWTISSIAGEVICHFSYEQAKAAKVLKDLFLAATTGDAK